MNVIDLEILIPASPEFIWRFLGDPSALPKWQEDVSSVSFLSTQRDGQGARWRASSEKSNDVVVEVSAWYDTLGYEYRLMDGASFADNQGRIRLHEVTDGTLVRWTFQYEAGGLFGGLRNAMRLKRSTTNQLQASLRNLHQLIMQESGGISTHEAKASVREAPDVGERLSYQPRHPSAFHEETPEELAEDATEAASYRQPVAYDEFEAAPAPLLADTDTKPNPVAISSAADEELLTAPEPAPDDTKPIRVSPPLIETPAAPETRLPEPQLPEPRIPDARLTEPRLPETRRPEPRLPEPQLPEPRIPDARLTEPRLPETRRPETRLPEPVIEPEPISRPAASTLPSETRDSAHLSVFEVFGLRKPSEANSRASRAEAPPPARRDLGAPILFPRREVAESAPRPEPAPRPEVEQDARESSAAYGRIIGWRRQARRRKAVIRSHN